MVDAVGGGGVRAGDVLGLFLLGMPRRYGYGPGR